MQIQPINRTEVFYVKPDKNITVPINTLNTKEASFSVAFYGTQQVTKSVTSRIKQEKSKLIRNLTEILKTNVPAKSIDEIIHSIIKRIHALEKYREKRVEELYTEAELISNSSYHNNRQKEAQLRRVRKELNDLEKMKPDLTIPKEKPVDDEYDFRLLNIYKSALMQDDFDLRGATFEYYKWLDTISSREQLAREFPKIKIPADPREVISKKIIDTIPRDFFEKVDEYIINMDNKGATSFLSTFFDELFIKIAPQFGMDKEQFFIVAGKDIVDNTMKVYENIKINNDRFSSIPQKRKNITPQFTDIDKALLSINYDKFVTHVITQHYLFGKKLADIEYTEKDKTIKVASLKGSEYKFEKFPEKIKKFITDAEKIRLLQRDYQKFTTEDLKERLNYYLNSELGNNEEIFDIIAEFENCRYTEEDKQYLIRLLRELDKISDNETSLEEGVNWLKTNNIKPHGTEKLNQQEIAEAKAKLKLEKEKLREFNELRTKFNNTINRLYMQDLAYVADICSKYYPESQDEKAIETAKKVIKIITTSLAADKEKAKTQILRWEIYNDYLSENPDSPILKEAEAFGKEFSQEFQQDRIGQFLLNREIIQNYPQSRQWSNNPQLLDKIIEKFGDTKDLATRYLCKYEDYLAMDERQKSSISEILRMFDYKNADDRIILKSIIEEDYINRDTSVFVHSAGLSEATKRTIGKNAKQQILDKYKFPGCIEFFKAFEDALPLDAKYRGTAGVKRTDKYDSKMEYKYEIKIMGHVDRLFATNKDFYFDVYSELGFH